MQKGFNDLSFFMHVKVFLVKRKLEGLKFIN